MTKKIYILIPATLLLSLIQGTARSSEPVPNEKQLEFFERRIRPILVDNCYVCHSEHHKEAGGVRVDEFRSLVDERDNGAAIVPGDSAASKLFQRISHKDDSKTMPPDRRLSEEEITAIKQWIDDGAAWPPIVVPDDIDQTLDSLAIYQRTKESHWAWQPLPEVEVPEFDASNPLADWARHDVDKFIAEQLTAHNLKPGADAGKVDILRRLYFDLTGLPPSESDLLAFLLDDSETAIESVVDRLLDSSAFGERWGRHWLDVARYGESTGSARNLPYPHAWRYRDYVIDSFNADKPFNQFIQEQIAGDLLPADSLAKKKDQLIATGFLALGVKDVNQRFQVRYDMDNVDEQIDTVTRAVLGLTVSCARCHDHKFDPVSTRDYYALAGIFTSTELCDALRNQMGGGGLAYYVPERLLHLSANASQELSPEQQEQIAEKQAAFDEARAAFIRVRDSLQQEGGQQQTTQLQKARRAMRLKQEELVAAKDPAKRGPVAFGVRDSKRPSDTEIRFRGEAEKYGPVVPRGFLSVLDYVPSDDIPADRSGRYELATWLTHPDNALTSRVIVNRVWQHLFGRGLVATVDNFGVTGDAPTHPKLLDFLARKFVADGWSVKKLVKDLVLTRTYQLAASRDEAAFAVDPENKFLWRHSPRRLEAEEIRDSMLALSAEIDWARPGSTPAYSLPVREIRDNGPEAALLREYAAKSRHRSVYLPLLRGIVPTSLSVFDFAEQGMVTGKRTNTTVPAQSLFMLNDRFVRYYSLALAQNFIKEGAAAQADAIARLYRSILGRQPSSKEIHLAEQFLKEFAGEAASLADAESSDGVMLASTTSEDGTTQSSEATVGPQQASVVKEPTPSEKEEAVKARQALLAAGDQNDTSEVASGDLELPESVDPTTAAYAAFIQSLFASGEFRYLR